MSMDTGETSSLSHCPNVSKTKIGMEISPMKKNVSSKASILTKPQDTTLQKMAQSCGNMGYAPCVISYMLYTIGGGGCSVHPCD